MVVVMFYTKNMDFNNLTRVILLKYALFKLYIKKRIRIFFKKEKRDYFVNPIMNVSRLVSCGISKQSFM